MRLYLSSFRLGRQPHRLVELAQGRKHAAVILNACDTMADAERQIRVEQEMVALQGLGFDAVELDLRNYFNDVESADIDKLVQYYIDNHMLFKALRDGEAIVIDGEQEHFLD